jgi:cytochrome c oxidase subunit 2
MWNFPLFPDQASSVAGRVDALYFFVLGIVVFFTTLICVLILSLAIKYRRGSRADRSNPVVQNLTIESLWIGIPLVIVLGIFSWSTHVYFELYDPPGDAVQLDVIGKQWMWKLQHPEGMREINELHVPIGRAVKLRMTSQDVIHSFFIPAFRIKQDVLPGRDTSLWFRPTRVGRYHLFCAEYCGTNHSRMIGWVDVMEPADYERWLSSRSNVNAPMAAEGERLFVRYHCGGCHGATSRFNAPKLEGVYGGKVPIMKDNKEVVFVDADDRYIRDSVLLPKSEVVAGYEPIMPSFKDVIPEEDLLKILAYIRSIGRGSAAR